jgi:alkaline phosphatase
MIPVYAYGPGAEMFSGIMDNTDVFFAMNKAVGVNSLSEYKCH